MRNIFLFTLLLLIQSVLGQSMMAPNPLSPNEKLSSDAYIVLKTNKFLDFKGRDFMEEIIDGQMYKKTDLNNFFSYRKDWNTIENETFYNYKQNNPKYSYTYTDNTMTESYTLYGSYDVQRDIKIKYNAKGFVLSREEKITINNIFKERRLTINEFDSKNRVIKIIHTSEYLKKEEDKKAVIAITYEVDLIKVTSDNGTIICKFITGANPEGFISRLSPRETISQFMHALTGENPKKAKDHLSDQMRENNQSLPKWVSAQSMGGTDTYSSDKVIAEESWLIEFSVGKKERRNVQLTLIKQINGWKIDRFVIDQSIESARPL